MMFYPTDNILNQDETGLNYLETRGRNICEAGKNHLLKFLSKYRRAQ